MDNEILATKNARKIIQDAIFKDLQYKTKSDASFVTNQLIKKFDERKDKQKAEEEEIRKKTEEKIVDQESSLLKANSSAKNMQPDDN